MTLPIPDNLKGLPEITADEIRKMTGEGESVRFEGKVVQGDALEALHGAFFKGVPVHVEGSLIDGNLDFTKGPTVPLEEAEGIGSKINRDLLKALGVRGVVVVAAPISFGNGTYIKGSVQATAADFSGSFSIWDSTIAEWAEFNTARFNSRTSFTKVTFSRAASFLGATFGHGVFFQGTRFGDRVVFAGAIFGNEADFWCATFGDGANFRDATFGHRASFQEARFGDRASFVRAIFGNGANFLDSTFGSEAHFGGATFGESAEFNNITLGDGASFEGATFKGPVVFRRLKERVGRSDSPVFEGGVDFQNVRMDQPRVVIFQRVDLSKASFLNTRLDKVRFIDVKWAERDKRRSLFDEEFVKENKNYELVAQLYRQLKKNYEELRDYPGAGDFHYGEMEMTLKMHQEKKEWFSWLLTRAYKFLSGYGEKAERAIVIALAILLVPALCYDLGSMTLNHPTKFLRDFTDYLLQSLGYMTFRIYETPIKWWWKILMVAQAILGPIQLALTALALRRKFRR